MIIVQNKCIHYNNVFENFDGLLFVSIAIESCLPCKRALQVEGLRENKCEPSASAFKKENIEKILH